jgi:hypothetical protein
MFLDFHCRNSCVYLVPLFHISLYPFPLRLYFHLSPLSDIKRKSSTKFWLIINIFFDRIINIFLKKIRKGKIIIGSNNNFTIVSKKISSLCQRKRQIPYFFIKQNTFHTHFISGETKSDFFFKMKDNVTNLNIKT